jgi:hypothetical protein
MNSLKALTGNTERGRSSAIPVREDFVGKFDGDGLQPWLCGSGVLYTQF